MVIHMLAGGLLTFLLFVFIRRMNIVSDVRLFWAQHHNYFASLRSREACVGAVRSP